MATKPENIVADTVAELAENAGVAIIWAEWNSEITESLYKSCRETLIANGVLEDNIAEFKVPGSFELTFAANTLAKNAMFDAIICLGCVIQGETPHFDFICNAVANGLTQISINEDIPVIFGVLTTLTLEQAKERAGGKLGNKGTEAALTALKLLPLIDAVSYAQENSDWEEIDE